MQTQEKSALDLNLFNVSGEFEDIEMVINELSGDVEMSVMSRRC
jgi:hypothetical protein